MLRVALATLAVLLGGLAVSASAADTVWLCRPGLAANPCAADRAATVQRSSGPNRVERPRRAGRPRVDCFYVYPTASAQPTRNANLEVDDELRDVARAQASRFTDVCRVFAPVYRQITLSGLFMGGTDEERERSRALPYADVRAAWRTYLRRDNRGRGVVLIGHSQGTGVLRRLVREEIEPRRRERRRLVSALLLGGDVPVGELGRIAPCRTGRQVGCLVAYSAFTTTPPPNTLFGRGDDGERVVCTNPAALGGGSAPLRPAFLVNAAGGLLGSLAGVPGVRTPWVTQPGLYRARCVAQGDLTWLQVDAAAGDPRPTPDTPLGPTWGLHLDDVNVAVGDLVALVRRQAQAFRARR